MILRQLDLQTALRRLGALRKNVEDQRAAVEHGHARDFLQRTDLRGRKVVVKNDHIGLGRLQQVAQLLCLALADKAVRIGRMAVLQHLGGAGAARSLQKRLQLVQCFIGGGVLFFEAVGIQPDQNRLLAKHTLVVFHLYLP